MSGPRAERWVLWVGHRARDRLWPAGLLLALGALALGLGAARGAPLPLALGALFLSLAASHFERVLFTRVVERQAAELRALRPPPAA